MKKTAQDYDVKVAEIDKKELDFKRTVYDELRQQERLAEYLVFAQEAVSITDNTVFRGKAGQMKLRDKVADKWRDFLKRYALQAKPHPVMVAWKRFAGCLRANSPPRRLPSRKNSRSRKAAARRRSPPPLPKRRRSR
jgi:hypothetical protein